MNIPVVWDIESAVVLNKIDKKSAKLQKMYLNELEHLIKEFTDKQSKIKQEFGYLTQRDH